MVAGEIMTRVDAELIFLARLAGLMLIAAPKVVLSRVALFP